ncbi:sensor histidine kinase [Nocardia terpenica]|uniref:histidine kinase n=1 Tax=Nocardia terpenica TaxID=455432 RepID=A0A291RKN2_9NOCA|nr:histidine kinase [Nocardia terpenica]ATL67858.1 two-component sensor histidine kinase [Nocardia terpenica]
MISTLHRVRARYGRLVVVVVVTVTAVHNAAFSDSVGYLSLRSAIALLCGATLLLRRYRPVALAATVAATGVWGWPMSLPLLVALFDAAVAGRIALAVGAVAVALAANAVTHPTMPLAATQQYGSMLFPMLAVVGGLWAGSRRRLIESLAEQVEHLRVERELRERAARQAERTAIAAEMHDVLAHRLSLVALHAGVLATRADTLPGPIADRLTLLRTAATAALTDLRDVLGALRDPETHAPAAPPAPVLRDIDDLIAQARTAGQQVTTEVTGCADNAPAAHRLAVFRIVQEGLSNVRKHGTDIRAHVRIDYGPPATVVEVSNTAADYSIPSPMQTSTAPPGFGLVGLRERVEALGGRLEAGPDGSDTWVLRAYLSQDSGQKHAGITDAEQAGTTDGEPAERRTGNAPE